MMWRLLSAGMLLAASMPAMAVSGSAKDGEGAQDGAHYYQIEPALTVNIRDGESLRFLQVAINLRTKGNNLTDEINYHQAPIRHELLMLLSSVDFQKVVNTQHREEIRDKALLKVRATLATYSSIPEKQINAELDNVLFTHFVVQ